VRQMATVGKVKTHESIMRPHDSLVNLEIGRAARQTLDVDTPLLTVDVEGFKGTSLACQLNGINVLVTAVVSSTWVTLGVFVGHWGSEGIKNCTRRYVLGGDEDDGLALTLNLELLEFGWLELEICRSCVIETYHDLCNLWVSL
jgi:hypothetical protein